MSMAAKQGGHVRVGFENNLWRADGKLTNSNADIVTDTRIRIEAAGRSVMNVQQTRHFLALTTGAGREGEL